MQQETGDAPDLHAALAGGGVHVVCLADLEAPSTASLLADGAGLDDTERRLFCERVNAEDATGCLWPIARLSALPARFGRTTKSDAEDLRRCLARVLEVNATLCKCPVLILDLRDAAEAAGEIGTRLQDMLDQTAGSSQVRELRVLLPTPR